MKSVLAILLIVLLLGAVTGVQAETGTRAAFQAELDHLARSAGPSLGIAIKDLVSGDEFLANADAEFPLSSSIRICIVTELFRQAAAKKISLDKVYPFPESARIGGFGVLRYMSPGTVAMSLRDYATLMIMVNDSGAANFLTDLLGLDQINASLAAQGTPEIKFRHKALPRRAMSEEQDNVGTPRAVMRSLALIYEGKVVDRVTSDGILEVLARPKISFFPRHLPRGIRFAGRSGIGPEGRCEAGIVLLPERPYVICIMVRNPRTASPGAAGTKLAAARRLVPAVFALAWKYFQPDGFGEPRGSKQ